MQSLQFHIYRTLDVNDSVDHHGILHVSWALGAHAGFLCQGQYVFSLDVGCMQANACAQLVQHQACLTGAIQVKTHIANSVVKTGGEFVKNTSEETTHAFFSRSFHTCFTHLFTTVFTRCGKITTTTRDYDDDDANGCDGDDEHNYMHYDSNDCDGSDGR